MNKKILVAGMLAIAGISQAQQYLGLSNSNYSGVYGGLYNPAKLADDKIKLAVNLITVNGYANNDFYKFKSLKELIKNVDDFNNSATYDAKQKSANILINGEALLPSVQFTVNDKLGLGISTRMRVFTQGKDVNADFLRLLNKTDATFATTGLNADKFALKSNAISDIGLSAGYKMIDNTDLSLSIGAGLRLYTGIAYTNSSLKSITTTGKADDNGNVAIHIENGTFSSSLSPEQNYDNVFNNAGDVFGLLVGTNNKINTGRGFGGDIGAELKIKDANKPYKVKLGASVNDLGSISYRNIQKYSVNGGGVININKIDLVDINKTVNYLESRGITVKGIGEKTNMTVGLPTNVRAYIDVPINNNFFISANTLFNIAKTAETSPNNYYYGYAGLTPRFESKYFDVAVPLTYNFTSKDFKPGLAFRFGPLSIGSDDLKLLLTDAKGANLYAGLRFVLFKDNDTDKDGVVDAKDRCPLEAGPAQNQGCPWPDTDGDGILDKDDRCPNQAGPVENQGCPYPDTDNDGVLDKNDACPTIAGPVENNGCPWPDTDGDGVADKDDKCPTVFGLREYDGCPKTQTIIAEEVTGALKDIQFNFNKATLRPESDAKLNQAAEIIKSSNGGKFLVEGHTDKKGKDSYNLKLSRERAASVVSALEARGVNPDQLKSRGFGEQDARVPETASDAERMVDRKVVVKAADMAAWDSLQKSDLPVVKKKIVKKRVVRRRK